MATTKQHDKSRGNPRPTEANGPDSARGFIAIRSAWKSAVILAFVLTTFVLLQSLLPLRTAIQIGADEGFELAKATLCLKGYKLYSVVWNDQPPLHTFLITQVLKHISPSILGPRLVTTVFTAILLSSIFFIGLRIHGRLAAALATVLLLASPGFLELSSSCMLEIPALALAVAALCVLVNGTGNTALRGGRRDAGPTLIAGVLFGLALQMKLNAVIYLPLAALILWLRHREAASPGGSATLKPAIRAAEHPARRSPNPTRNTPHPALSPHPMRGEGGRCPWLLLIFGGSLAASFVGIDLVVDGGAYLRHFQQSWTSHFAPTQSFEYGSAAGHPFDWSILLKNWDTTVPAVLGVAISVSRARKTRGAILPVAWLVLALSVFGLHKPWWAYYYIHTALPLCWCAAIGIGALWERARVRRSRGLFALLALYGLAAVPWMAGRVYLQAADIRHSPQTYSSLVLQEIARLKPYTQWFYAAEPIYSFHAGIPMPPQLAVVPLKRLWSGDMTNVRLAAEMGKVKPGLILLANDGREVPFEDLIQAEYRLIYQDARHRLYAHKTLAGK